MGLTEKWHKQKLTKEDIKAWVKDQWQAKGLTEDETDHVVRCMFSIFLSYHSEYELGHFLTAVVENDFGKACGRADKINLKALGLYALFLFNVAPMDYKAKIL